jgi:hypothetical protein
MFTFQFRRDVAIDWAAKNPVLREAEPGYEIDTRKLKFGDGRTRWNDLPYFAGGGSVELPDNILTIEQFNAHLASADPHIAYDGVDPVLYYENAKV